MTHSAEHQVTQVMRSVVRALRAQQYSVSITDADLEVYALNIEDDASLVEDRWRPIELTFTLSDMRRAIEQQSTDSGNEGLWPGDDAHEIARKLIVSSVLEAAEKAMSRGGVIVMQNGIPVAASRTRD